jgi:hypothetical protein
VSWGELPFQVLVRGSESRLRSQDVTEAQVAKPERGPVLGQMEVSQLGPLLEGVRPALEVAIVGQVPHGFRHKAVADGLQWRDAGLGVGQAWEPSHDVDDGFGAQSDDSGAAHMLDGDEPIPDRPPDRSPFLLVADRPLRVVGRDNQALAHAGDCGRTAVPGRRSRRYRKGSPAPPGDSGAPPDGAASLAAPGLKPGEAVGEAPSAPAPPTRGFTAHPCPRCITGPGTSGILYLALTNSPPVSLPVKLPHPQLLWRAAPLV